MELVYLIAGTLGLGAAFFAFNRSRGAVLRVAGPWLLILTICLVATILLDPSNRGYSWVAIRHYDFIEDVSGALGFFLSFAVESVLIAQLLLRSKPRLPVFLVMFFFAAMATWFLTFLAWVAVLED